MKYKLNWTPSIVEKYLVKYFEFTVLYARTRSITELMPVSDIVLVKRIGATFNQILFDISSST